MIVEGQCTIFLNYNYLSGPLPKRDRHPQQYLWMVYWPTFAYISTSHLRV